MPISSGGEGHVGLGVDTSIKWMPDGKNNFCDFKSHNSYLQRYLSLRGGAGGDKINTHEAVKQNKAHTVSRMHDEQVSMNESVNPDHQKHGQNHPDQHHNRLASDSTSTCDSPSKAPIKKQVAQSIAPTKRTMDPSTATKKKSSACTLL
ncbi:hypothetical protein XENTR_v10001092 [Xenopus tropicalis]|nr:hypothetical protein XENTR_v10001092 [Xenopus tropicalis]